MKIDGAVWVGTGRQGIYRIYQGKTDHFASSDGLTADAVAGFFQDREGTLWIATSKGIDSFRDLPVVSYSLKEGLSGDSVSTVLAAQDGTVWIGTSGALDSIRQGKISAIRTNAGLPGRDVTTMYEDHSGHLWLGLDSGLFVLDHGVFHSIRNTNGKALGIVYSITEDARNSIWVRTHPDLLLRVDGLQVRQVIESPEIAKCFALAADPGDGIWLGFVNGDLARYRGGHMDSYPADSKVSTAKIRKLLPESDGSVVGVTEQGLVWWKNGKRAALNTQNGLPCDELYTVVKDQLGAFWFYARCGLFSITAPRMTAWQSNTGSRVQVEMYDVFDGVQPGITSLQPQGTLAADEHLWFANDSILQTIDPRAVQRNTLPPNVVVEKVVADKNSYSSNEEFHLPALTRNVQIDYTALSFVAPQKVRFRYKLEGHDSDWQDPQTRRQAFYSDLSPGKYRFRVLGCNNDGVWNEAGSSLEFSLAPAFFQTTRFLILCAACFLAVLWLVYLLRMRQVAAGIRARMEERLGERERIARELHDTLLQSIQGLILRFHAVAKQIPAGEPIRQNIESALDRAEEAVTEGRERVLNLRAAQTSANDLAAAFPPLAGQTLHDSTTDLKVVVEGNARPLHPWVREEVYSIGREAIVNAFQHAGGTHIEVEIGYGARELRLRIRDDGRGMDPEILNAGGKHGHWGLKGMRERAEGIGAELQIWSGAGTGTEVDLRVPALRAYPNQVAAARWLWLRGVWGRNR
jgi:signal transduction histidine kinase/streptogramin lyase